MEKDQAKHSVDLFFQQVATATEVTPGFGKAVVPICTFQHDSIIAERTGVLFQVGDSHFLLTASHHLKDLIRQTIPLFIPVAFPDKDPACLTQCVFHGIDAHDVDVAIAKLDHEAVNALLPTQRFLRLYEFELQERQDNALYLVCGFPAKWPQRDALSHPKRMAFFGTRYLGDLNPASEFDPRIHLILGYEQNGLGVLDREPVTLPEVHGMSGGGIWRVAEYNCRSLVNWKSENCKLVAIQHSWDRKRNYIKATWIRHALSLIWHHYPELRPALSIIYP